MAYTGHFLQYLCSGGADRHKLITSFTLTYFITTSFKATWPQKLLTLVTAGLLGVNRHYSVLWIHCKSTRSFISALAELLLLLPVLCWLAFHLSVSLMLVHSCTHQLCHMA